MRNLKKKFSPSFLLTIFLKNTLENDIELIIAFQYKICKFGYDIDEIFEFEEKIKNTIENWDSQFLSLRFQFKPQTISNGYPN